MKRIRKRFARLGRVAPSTTVTDRNQLWNVYGDSKQMYFEQLWAPKEQSVAMSLSDALDFAINRNVKVNEIEYRLGLCRDGLYVLEHGSIGKKIIPFRDIVDLFRGQVIIPCPQ